MDKRHFNKSQRMQLKALICVLGIILLLILLIVKLLLSFMPREPEQEIHIPVIEQLSNVWIMEADGEGLLIFRNGAEERYSYTENMEKDNVGNSPASEAQELNTESGFEQQEKWSWAQGKPESVREQVADIELTDGTITDIQIKTEKINGKILSADAAGVELEGYGRIPFATDYKGYRIYKTLTMCSYSDLLFGYSFADFVLEDGAICAILLAREEAMESIRVLIKTSDFSGLLHEQVILTADTSFTIQYGTYDNRQAEQHMAGEEIVIDKSSTYFSGDRVEIIPDVLTGKVSLKSVNRSQGVPGYRGKMELLLTEEGIAVINEVALEEYLYCVVPSEMPASYPDEALQAQAVCARTYAYGHMQNAGYPQYGAHVDDSTAYQVYNNILEQESTTTAVKETYGQLLFTAEGGLASTYYYSTSCGVGTDANVWKTDAAKQITYLRGKAINKETMEALQKAAGEASEQTGEAGNEMEVLLDKAELLKDEAAFAEFITTTNGDDFEVAESWYRWSYTVHELNVERMLEVLQKRYQANSKLILTLQGEEYVSEPIAEFTKINKLYIAKRGSGGVADELILETDGNTYKVISEYNIRAVLNDGSTKVLRQDGSEASAPNLLPSAYFILAPVMEQDTVSAYTLTGGGYGHGVGMSQNAARSMANCGYTAEQILTFFYEGCLVQKVYGQDMQG